jgi:hypothetical protein
VKNDLKSSAYAGDWLSDFALVAIYTEDSNLVDSASSHTLVSKIKPCMSKYKYFTLKLRTAHYISFSLFDSLLLLGYP